MCLAAHAMSFVSAAVETLDATSLRVSCLRMPSCQTGTSAAVLHGVQPRSLPVRGADAIPAPEQAQERAEKAASDAAEMEAQYHAAWAGAEAGQSAGRALLDQLTKVGCQALQLLQGPCHLTLPASP